MKVITRSLLLTAPAVALYSVVLPWVALCLDRWFGFVWHFPLWMEPVAALAVLVGGAAAIWSFWALTVSGKGTPNPLAPATELVIEGPFRRSRNPLMLGGWLCGAGLACLLRSPCLLALVALVAIAGACYVRLIEEPRLLTRFGAAYAQYAGRTPRWLVSPCHGGKAG
jgi:protein-S-isoprenylcysteine O-methyltransferase Ste14